MIVIHTFICNIINVHVFVEALHKIYIIEIPIEICTCILISDAFDA